MGLCSNPAAMRADARILDDWKMRKCLSVGQGNNVVASHKFDNIEDIKHDWLLMAAGVNVRFAGELQSFIQQRVLKSGLYSSTSEYIRDLVRRDYEQEEQRKWARLRQELGAGIEASESEFVTLDAESLLTKARKRKKAHDR